MFFLDSKNCGSQCVVLGGLCARPRHACAKSSRLSEADAGLLARLATKFLDFGGVVQSDALFEIRVPKKTAAVKPPVGIEPTTIRLRSACSTN